MGILFFDIETILDPQRVWEALDCNTFEYDSSTILSNETVAIMKEKFWDNFDFMPEFHSILTICVGKIEADWNIVTKNLAGTEKEMIEQFFALTEYTDWKKILPNILCGFNIKSFDIPFIVKRWLFHWVRVPEYIKVFGKKPWDMENIKDLYDIYKHTWFKSCSLDTLCKFLSIPTPKQWIDGSQVQKFHDEWRDQEIVTYCMNDVEATIRVHQRFSELNLI